MGSAGISEETTTTGGAGDVLSAKDCPPLRSAAAADPTFLDEAPELLPPARETLEDAGEEPALDEAPFREPVYAELAGTEPPLGGG